MNVLTMNDEFARWSARPEVQVAAREHILDHAPDGQQMAGFVHKLENPGFVPSTRCMHFGVIDAMNGIFWQHFSGLEVIHGVASRGNLNALAMQDAESDWRRVFPIFAWAIGFRPEGDLAPPQTGSPMLRKVPC